MTCHKNIIVMILFNFCTMYEVQTVQHVDNVITFKILSDDKL